MAYVPSKKIEEFIIRNEDGSEKYHYYLFPYDGKFFTVCHNLDESSETAPIFQTQFTDPEKPAVKGTYTFVMKDGHFDATEVDNRFFCKVVKVGESVPKMVEIPISKNNCQSCDIFFALPASPAAERVTKINAEFADHAKDVTPLKEVQIKEHDITSVHPIPEGNLEYKQEGVSYFYLPYKNGEAKPYLRVMQHEGKLFINLKGLNEEDKTRNTTCEIFSANFVELEGKSLLQLELNVNGQRKAINLRIAKENNETMLEDLNKLVSNTLISSSEIEVFDCPRMENLVVDPVLNPENVVEEFEKNENLRRSIKTGQLLEEQVLSLNEESLTGLKQNIALDETLGLGKNKTQEFTLFDSKSYSTKSTSSVISGALLTVTTQESEKPVAVFAKEKSKDSDGHDVEGVKLRISKEFLDDFKAKNPKVVLPDSAEKDGYVSYDIAALKLTKNLTIDDVSVKGAGSDFAILFSALGCQIKDKDGNIGKQTNETSPYNIGVSTEFVVDAFNEKNGCSLDRTDPAYSALLISSIQMMRKNANEKDESAKEKEVSVKLPNETSPKVELYSVPLKIKGKDGKDEIHYLNVRKEEEKTYVYLHLTSESKNGIAIPRFYEVHVGGLEDKNPKGEVENPSLYLGLKDKGSNITSVNIDLDYAANAESLVSIEELMKEPFGKTPSLEESKVAEKGEREIGGKTFSVYPRPNEPGARITSFEEVAKLTRSKEETKEREPSLERSGVIADPPVIERPKNTEKTVIYPGGSGGGGGGGGDDVIDEDEPMPGDISWSTKIGKDKEKPKTGVRKMLLALFALSVALSVFLPFMQIAAIVFGSVAVLNEVRPWIIDEINLYKTGKSNKKPKFEKESSKEKKLEKAKNKEILHGNQFINLEEKRLEILHNDKLTDKEKNKLIKKLDKEIEKKKKEIEKNKKSQIILDGKIKKAKIIVEAKKLKKWKKNKNKETKKINKVHNKNLKPFQEKEIFAKEKLEKLNAEKSEYLEYLEFENLRDKEARGETLTTEEKEKLEKLRKKLKKSKKSKSTDYDSEISSARESLESISKEKKEKQKEIRIKQKQRNEHLKELKLQQFKKSETIRKEYEKETNYKISSDETLNEALNESLEKQRLNNPKFIKPQFQDIIKNQKHEKKNANGSSINLEQFILSDETIEKLPDELKEEALFEKSRIEKIKANQEGKNTGDAEKGRGL